MKSGAAGERVLVNGTEMARRYGVTVPTFMSWYHQGKITAEVAMGKVFRFDPEKVAADLRKHAAKQQQKPAGKSGNLVIVG